MDDLRVLRNKNIRKQLETGLKRISGDPGSDVYGEGSDVYGEGAFQRTRFDVHTGNHFLLRMSFIAFQSSTNEITAKLKTNISQLTSSNGRFRPNRYWVYVIRAILCNILKAPLQTHW